MIRIIRSRNILYIYNYKCLVIDSTRLRFRICLAQISNKTALFAQKGLLHFDMFQNVIAILAFVLSFFFSSHELIAIVK